MVDIRGEILGMSDSNATLGDVVREIRDIKTALIQGDAILLDVEQVAAMLMCSPSHIYRLSDSGRMPRPVKLGHLAR